MRYSKNELKHPISRCRILTHHGTRSPTKIPPWIGVKKCLFCSFCTTGDEMVHLQFYPAFDDFINLLSTTDNNNNDHVLLWAARKLMGKA